MTTRINEYRRRVVRADEVTRQDNIIKGDLLTHSPALTDCRHKSPQKADRFFLAFLREPPRIAPGGRPPTLDGALCHPPVLSHPAAIDTPPAAPDPSPPGNPVYAPRGL
eukprot:8029039-Pyramimonas_sp.AAC.1